MQRAICALVDKIMETQCQTRQLIAGCSKHLASSLSTAELNHCSCTSTNVKMKAGMKENNVCEANGGGNRSTTEFY